MTTKIAFVGFRHPHIKDMFQRCEERDDIEVVACCEDDAATREALVASGEVAITHSDFQAVLNDVECDAIAVGDVYGKRGDLIQQALQAERHVISDKPICTSLEELDRIEQLSNQNKRVVSCMLDMRDVPTYLGMREILKSGEIGTVQAMSFDGQHPLLLGTRPDWYFEEGLHGGTLNDIAIHAIDMIPWATGLKFQSIVAARCWNATLPQFPHFKQCGQAMLTLDNGAGVICDVSYLAPDSFGYRFALYWRFTVWCDGGVMSTALNSPKITLYKNGMTEAREVDLPTGLPGEYLNSFIREIGGENDGLHLSSKEVLASSRLNLRIQQAADNNLTNIEL